MEVLITIAIIAAFAGGVYAYTQHKKGKLDFSRITDKINEYRGKDRIK